MKKSISIVVFCCVSFLGFSQVRYLDSVFNFIKHSNIVYGSNYDNLNQPTTLLMDVYEPENDTITLRPIIFFVHGGSFVGGSRSDQAINKTAQFFCKKGYVTVNIEYRVEQTQIITPFLNFAEPLSFYKAIARVTQDIKASIRYLKRDAQLNANQYRVDTTRMFLYGSSAGAIGGLTAVFLNDTLEMSKGFKTAYSELGGLDGDSGNPGYDIAGIRAVVSCSGATDSFNYLSNNRDIGLLAFHNVPDFVVPYDVGCFETVFCHLGYFYGSNSLTQKARLLGMNYEYYPINKVGHPVDAESDSATRVFILQKTTDFLYKILNASSPTLVRSNEIKSIKCYPNPSNGSITIRIPEELQFCRTTIQFSDVLGKVAYTATVTGKEQLLLQQESLTDGVYLLTISSGEKQYVSKIIIAH